VTSHTSHLREGTIDRQIHVTNLPYVAVAGRVNVETFLNTVLSFTRILHEVDSRQFL